MPRPQIIRGTGCGAGVLESAELVGCGHEAVVAGAPEAGRGAPPPSRRGLIPSRCAPPPSRGAGPLSCCGDRFSPRDGEATGPRPMARAQASSGPWCDGVILARRRPCRAAASPCPVLDSPAWAARPRGCRPPGGLRLRRGARGRTAMKAWPCRAYRRPAGDSGPVRRLAVRQLPQVQRLGLRHEDRPQGPHEARQGLPPLQGHRQAHTHRPLALQPLGPHLPRGHRLKGEDRRPPAIRRTPQHAVARWARSPVNASSLPAPGAGRAYPPIHLARKRVSLP